MNRALQQAQVGFAQQMGLRPEKDKTVAQVAEEKMGIKDLDSIVESQAVEARSRSPSTRRTSSRPILPSPRRRCP